jgi:hypothetical protein
MSGGKVVSLADRRARIERPASGDPNEWIISRIVGVPVQHSDDVDPTDPNVTNETGPDT